MRAYDRSLARRSGSTHTDQQHHPALIRLGGPDTVLRTAVFKTNYRQLASDLKRLRPRQMLACATALPSFFHKRLTVQQAEAEIKGALARREATLLDLVRTRVYADAASPYLRLLKMAGCEFADLCDYVQRHGVERALEQLAREGVYLTSEEFKGKKDVVRAGQSFRVSPNDFQRTNSLYVYTIQSSGTRNEPVRSFIDLDWLTARAAATAVFFSAHGLWPYAHAIYDGILPASGGINNALLYAKIGKVVERWFARTMPINHWLEGGYHYLTTSLIVLAGKRFGPGFPMPEFLDIQDMARIVRWVEQRRRVGETCCITTAASNATRIARLALEMGMSLQGTKFIASGEPLTEAKCELIEQAGATATSRYAYGGGLNVGFGCAHPRHIDEIHINQHLLALLPHPQPLPGDGPPIRPLLCTTLHPLAPRLLLNVENGDYAALESRDCGCALATVGLTLHAYHIRSFEKFASEGMNFFYADLFELLEKTITVELGRGPGAAQAAPAAY